MLIHLWLVTSAHAQSGAVAPEVNAQHFRPTVDGLRTLWTDDSERLASGHFRAVFHYADDPLVYEFADGETQDLLGSILEADLMGALSYQSIRVGLVLPVFLASTSDLYADDGGLGDIALDAKLSLLDRKVSPIGLAGQARVSFPTSTLTNTPLGNPNVGWEIAGIADREFGKWLLAANLGIHGGNQVDLENVSLDDFLSFRSALGYAFNPDGGLTLEVAGQLPVSNEVSNPAGTPVEWLLGGYRHLGSGLVGRLGGGSGLTNGIASPDLRVVAGIGYDPSFDTVQDRDGDGWADGDDLCPDQPEDMDSVRDDDGCPDPDPMVRVTAVDPDGNPVSSAMISVIEVSTDADTVQGNGAVEQGFSPGNYTVLVDAEGFEQGSAMVTLDGYEEDVVAVTVILDPVISTLVIYVVDPTGEPVEAALTVNGDPLDGTIFTGDVGDYEVRAEAEGYAIGDRSVTTVLGEVTELTIRLSPSRVVLIADRIEIKESVFFDNDKATIKPESNGLLEEVSTLLVAHPELTKLRIEGHTDTRGNADYNRRLSQKRADAVLTFLIDHGVTADRLDAVGYGEDRPKSTATTEAAHAMNRRVDFFVVERSDD